MAICFGVMLLLAWLRPANTSATAENRPFRAGNLIIIAEET